MKTTLVMGFIVDGFHCWPGAVEQSDERVHFLSTRHRHRFFFHLEVEVANESSREIEFQVYARDTQDFIEETYGMPAEFGAMSCEEIALLLLLRDERLTSVRVMEDDEHGARVSR